MWYLFSILIIDCFHRVLSACYTYRHTVFLVVQGDSEFLGRAEAVPVVKLNTEKYRPAVLQWLTVTKRGSPRGELLAAFELFLVSLVYFFSVNVAVQ